MKVMILLKADANTEAGVLPDEKLLTAMGKYNEELTRAGVLLAGEGLQSSAKGARVKILRRQAQRDGRTIPRGKGVGRRILDVPGKVEGGGDRMG